MTSPEQVKPKSMPNVLPESMNNYLRMKTSLEQFGKIVSELTDDELKKLEQIMKQALRIYNAVLNSKEAKKVIVPDMQVNAAMRALKDRFNKDEDFQSVLEANSLTEKSLFVSLRNELHCETTLDYVANDCPPLTDEQAQVYYYQNLNKFSQPERRKASHLLITVNDEFEENTREQAVKRINDIKKSATPENFGKLALRHSECPTAVEEGELGLVSKGKLYPVLEQALFEMDPNTISEVIESEIGLHLLYCQSIVPEHMVSYPQAKEKIIEQHLVADQKRKQKQWIAALFI